MPKTEIDYSRTVMYKIICLGVNVLECYVGQTTDFIKRKNTHKTNCNKEAKKHFKVYQCINVNGGWLNWKMVPLEEYPCSSKIQASVREQFWIDKLKASLNMIPTYSRANGNEIPNGYYRCCCGKLVLEDGKELHEQKKWHQEFVQTP